MRKKDEDWFTSRYLQFSREYNIEWSRWFFGQETVTPKMLIGLSYTLFKNRYYAESVKRINSMDKKKAYKALPIEEILKRSLKRNKIDPTDREKVEEYAEKLADRFARKLEQIMLDEDVIIKLPDDANRNNRMKMYLYLGHGNKSSESPWNRFNFKTRKSSMIRMYVLRTGRWKGIRTPIALPILYIKTNAKTIDAAYRRISKGRVYREEVEYFNKMKSLLTEGSFIHNSVRKVIWRNPKNY